MTTYGLVNAKHPNIWTAALSIAANRASKIARLTADGHDDIAARNADSLRAHVEAFIAEHPNHPPRFAVALREAARS